MEVLGYLPMYRPGTSVRYGGSKAVVDYVILREGQLLVYLQHHPKPVKPEEIEATAVPLVRRKTTSLNG